MFQLAKGHEAMLQVIRNELKLPPTIYVSTGNKDHYSGILQRFSDIYKSMEKAAGQIVFLDQADGTEEIPSQVNAVILSH